MALVPALKVPWYGTKSKSSRSVTLTVFGTDESITLPLLVSTKVEEVRVMIATKLGVQLESFQFLQPGTGGKARILREMEEIRSHTYVKGIKSFVRAKQQWQHPFAIIGAGHSGLKQALSFLKGGIVNFVMFDRWEKVGGTAWVRQANTTSKLQTELGVYHLQYDPDCPAPRGMKCQPSTAELLEHFHQVSEEMGVLAHLTLNAEVMSIDVVSDPSDPTGFAQTYFLNVLRKGKEAEEAPLECSGVTAYPGGLIHPKRITYKGEEIFEGQIGYGMWNEFDYTRVRHETVATIGFGAFATENVRTCVEFGAKKTYIICRRKNLAMPRIVSWLINQSLYPVPAKMCMDVMSKMFVLANDDPWNHYAVMTTAKRTTCTLRQDSRFGIGDVYFLACYYGRCEVQVGSIKRLKSNSAQLENGVEIEIQHLIKTLGFLGDATCDQVMGIKKMEGFHVNGDLRRWVFSEQPGIDAGRFGGTSFSPGIITVCDMVTYFFNYPADTFMVLGNGALPIRKADPNSSRPAYVWDPRNSGTAMMIYSSVPGIAEAQAHYGVFNRERQLELHPLGKYLDELVDEWKKYCRLMREDLDESEFVPYPYSLQYIRDIVKEQDQEGEEWTRQSQGG